MVSAESYRIKCLHAPVRTARAAAILISEAAVSYRSSATILSNTYASASRLSAETNDHIRSTRAVRLYSILLPARRATIEIRDSGDIRRRVLQSGMT